MTEADATFFRWLIEWLCPRPPKPKPRIEFDVGPSMLKDPSQGK
jgi:hypothetical protein